MIFKNNLLKKIKSMINSPQRYNWEDTTSILTANVLMKNDIWIKAPNFSNPKWIQEKEFKVYSQFGDDGIIQYLIYYLNLKPKNGKFIEFGVGNYFESNTHFLLINNRWHGFVIDGNEKDIDFLKSSPIYWKYKLYAKKEFITKTNINHLLNLNEFKKIELLHIDLDGNDYWVLEFFKLK